MCIVNSSLYIQRCGYCITHSFVELCRTDLDPRLFLMWRTSITTWSKTKKKPILFSSIKLIREILCRICDGLRRINNVTSSVYIGLQHVTSTTRTEVKQIIGKYGRTKPEGIADCCKVIHENTECVCVDIALRDNYFFIWLIILDVYHTLWSVFVKLTHGL